MIDRILLILSVFGLLYGATYIYELKADNERIQTEFRNYKESVQKQFDDIQIQYQIRQDAVKEQSTVKTQAIKDTARVEVVASKPTLVQRKLNTALSRALEGIREASQ